MNFSRFFVDRPIFAGVLSLLIILGGFVAFYFFVMLVGPGAEPPASLT